MEKLFLCLDTSDKYLLSGSTAMAEEKNEPLSLSTPEYVLMELETGTVLLEKDENTRRSPASVTKIMTLLLIFDHIEEGDFCLEDMVTTSAYAKFMGSSQFFLEEGETQSVKTMIKCIVIASGTDPEISPDPFLFFYMDG